MTINRDTILRFVVCLHFFMISMVFLASWLPFSYHLSQCLILALGLWAIVHRDSVIQVELLMLIKFVSMILDSIAIGMYFQFGKQSVAPSASYFTLSAIFAILLLILKPVMLLLLNKVRQDRLSDPNFGNWTPTSGYISVDGR